MSPASSSEIECVHRLLRKEWDDIHFALHLPHAAVAMSLSTECVLCLHLVSRAWLSAEQPSNSLCGEYQTMSQLF